MFYPIIGSGLGRAIIGHHDKKGKRGLNRSLTVGVSLARIFFFKRVKFLLRPYIKSEISNSIMVPKLSFHFRKLGYKSSNSLKTLYDDIQNFFDPTNLYHYCYVDDNVLLLGL